MRVFLFRNSVNPIDYCITATKPVRLPAVSQQGRSIAARGYFRYTEPRILHDVR
jgi:hypothetical protein